MYASSCAQERGGPVIVLEVGAGDRRTRPALRVRNHGMLSYLPSDSLTSFLKLRWSLRLRGSWAFSFALLSKGETILVFNV